MLDDTWKSYQGKGSMFEGTYSGMHLIKTRYVIDSIIDNDPGTFGTAVLVDLQETDSLFGCVLTRTRCTHSSFFIINRGDEG